jgi:hypothetical protein
MGSGAGMMRSTLVPGGSGSLASLWRLGAGVFGLIAAGVSAWAAAPSFERDVRPILKAHCFHCHGEEGETKGDLDLRLRRFIEAGGESGSALVAGEPARSLLLEVVKSGEMPKGEKKLTADEIGVIEAWIAGGATTLRPEPEQISGHYITEEEREWWAFQPVRRPPVPRLASHPVDAFLLEKLRDKGLGFSTEAPPATLVRRAFFDLIGLPPPVEEVREFERQCTEAGDVAGPFEALIDRLLARQEYGERWGRHWLDVAGYADSEGYDDRDTDRVSAWRYRDYVIRAMNADMPFDRFIQEQLAGDELAGYPKPGILSEEDVDKLTATGFLRMAPDGTGADKGKEARNAVITETVKIVSSALLGMTVGCAECHDHRFDPILQADFYRLRAVFEPGLNFEQWRDPAAREIALRTPEDEAREKMVKEEVAELEAVHKARLEGYQAWLLDAEIAAVPEEAREPGRVAALKWQKDRDASLSDDEKKLLADYPFLKISSSEGPLNLHIQRHKEKAKEFTADVEAHRAAVATAREKLPEIASLRALWERTDQPPPVTRLLLRGNVESPGEEVAPGDLTVLDGVLPVNLPAKDAVLPTSGRRLAYARHLTSGKHPLVARVLVNRFWMHHFGRGIVGTTGDFGAQGEDPTHPELLDWLASEFIEGGWSLKKFHRLVMTSAAYRQSSQRRPEAEAVDAANELLWRMNMRRLEAETIRDATLLVSGSLNPAAFGAPVPVAEDANAQVVVGGGEPDEAGAAFRRSVYVTQKRSAPPWQLAVFDAPQMEPNCELRNVSNVAPQSLLLMNSAFVVEQSRAMARRVVSEAGGDLKEQIRRAWELAFSRAPDSGETRDALEFLEQQLRDMPAGSDAAANALASLCQTLLGSNPFLYAE